MKTLHSLIRQPVKTLVGVLLIAFAAIILIVSTGQFASTALAKENLSDGYSTVAVISDEYFWEVSETTWSNSLQIADEETRVWAEEAIQNRKDIFQMESFTEVYSAYAPQLSPDNFSRHEFGNRMGLFDFYSGNPYRSAVLEITVTAVGDLRGEVLTAYKAPGEDWREYCESIYILCVGTVENAVGLEEGFASPVGKTIVLTIKTFDEEALQAMELEEGQRYLVYGMDYSDMKDSILNSQISIYSSLYEELFGPAEEGEDGPEFDEILKQIDCHMTVFDSASMPIYYDGENGIELRRDLREFNYMEEGLLQTAYVPSEEVVPQYVVPTVVKLERTAEEFLNSDDGILWRQMLDNMEISNHGFPVLALDKLGYQMAFAREDARIVDGRDFTEAERKEGAKVCILSESLATDNGLSVGDTLNLQTYAHDYNIGTQGLGLAISTDFPNAASYSHILGFSSEPEEYTIVGLYRQNNAWENTDDPYGFTPNTIFVPKGSITGDARTGSKGIFYSIVLHNGKIKELQKLQNEAGYPDLFLCFDQGYTEIAEALDAYEGVSQKAFYVGLAGCAVILILFLVLFPLQQGKNLDIMCSLGAPRGKRIGFILGSSLGIFLPGAVLGGTAGALLWKKAAEKLMESVHVTIPMSADTVLLSVSLTGILLLGMLILVALLALIVSGEKGLIKRK